MFTFCFIVQSQRNEPNANPISVASPPARMHGFPVRAQYSSLQLSNCWTIVRNGQRSKQAGDEAMVCAVFMQLLPQMEVVPQGTHWNLPETCSVCNRPEFAETDRFKVPESKEVITERVQTNLEYYSGNYLAIAGICFAMVWYVS